MNPFKFLLRYRAVRRAQLAAAAARTGGDEARDARRWRDAAAAYQRYLALRPDDAPIWVQLGHALKESGDLADAEVAYRRASEIAPRDHDAPLQLGHVLKLQGRLADARLAYARSDELAPINHAADELATLSGADVVQRRPGLANVSPARRDREAEARLIAAEADLVHSPEDPAAHRTVSAALLRAGRRPAAIAAAQAAFALAPERRNWQAIRRAGGVPPSEGLPSDGLPKGGNPGAHLYDVTDLLNLVRDTGRATGIQRVQLGLAQGILADPQAASAARFVFLAERFGPLWTLLRADLQAITTYCLAEPHDLQRAETLVMAAMERASPTHLPSARLFFIMGAFWFWAGAPAALAKLRAAGLRIGVMVFDLIPITHPEHTSSGTVTAFRKGLCEGAGLWDFALTISEFTARELARQMALLEAPAMPIRPMPLAHRISPPDKPDADAFPENLEDLRGRDYILCVGTIESRKNHMALFQAWQILLRDGVDVPPLVIVGRAGWRVGDLMAQLESTRFLDGKIRLLHGISDPELEGLYRGCLFSIFPSFTEGWGLPVGESLALGKLCLAAMEGATPEAAAGFAEPIDAFSPRDIASRVRHFVTDRGALADAEARLREGFSPRGWPDVTRHFLSELADCMDQPAPQRPVPELLRMTPGSSLSFVPEGGPWPRASLALGPGFEPPEGPGAWLIGPSGTVHLECAAPLTLWLRLFAVPWASENRAGLAVGDAPLRWVSLQAGQEAMVALNVPAGPVTLRLVVDGPQDPPPEGDHRPIRVALCEIIAEAHAEARLIPGRPVIFGPAAPDQHWLSLLAEGWDQAADTTGVPALAPRAVLRFRAPAAGDLRLLLHLTVRPGAVGRLIYPGGSVDLTESGGPLLLPVAVTSDAEGWAELALTMADGGVPLLHLAALQWAAEADVAARLAMIEAVVLPESGSARTQTAERLLAIETRLRVENAHIAAPLPGGEAGRAARRLGAARPGAQ